MKNRRFPYLALLTWLTIGGSTQADPLGEAPAYLTKELSQPTNTAAIIRRIWAPGLNQGFVPQGLTTYQGKILVSAYTSTDPKINHGPARVFQVDPITGKTVGYFDLPRDCLHAGGLAMVGPDQVVVADTQSLYKIILSAALKTHATGQALVSQIHLAGALTGSFVDFDGRTLWIGTASPDPKKALAYALPLSIFDRPWATIKETAARATLPIPAYGNGMAFDTEGNMWVASSNSQMGKLTKLAPTTGKVLATFPTVAGIEDLGFDQSDRLWAVCEAGSIRWSGWAQTFPLIFQIDCAQLKP